MEPLCVRQNHPHVRRLSQMRRSADHAQISSTDFTPHAPAADHPEAGRTEKRTTMTTTEGRSDRRWMGAWAIYGRYQGARAKSQALLRGEETRRRAGRIHRIVLALGVLVGLVISATASAGAAPNPGRQTRVSLAPTVSVGSGPTGLAYDAQTHTLYVANQNSSSVSVITTKSCHAGDTKGCAQRVGAVAIGSGAVPLGVA